MLKDAVNITEDYDLLLESIQKNYYLLSNGSENSYYKFNNRMLLSNSSEFLSAVKRDMGGEIIQDSAIGSFLYFGSEVVD